MRATKFRLLMLPLAAAAALTLGACGDDSSSDAEGVGTGSGTGAAAESRYLQTLESMGVDVSDPTALIGKGKQICSDLGAGKTINDLVDVQAADPGREAAVVGAAVGAFCPDQQANLVPDLPDGTGN